MFAQLLLPLCFQAVTPINAVATTPPAAEPDHHLVKVIVKDARTLDKLLALDLDLAACNALEIPAREVEVIAEDSDIDKIKAAGLDYTVAVRNLEDTIGKELSKFKFPNDLTPAVGQGGMGGHYTWVQIVAHLDKFAKDHPAICTTKVSIGKSIEGRDLWMVKISDNVNKDELEPEVLYDALHHAREPVSCTTTLVFMDWLLSNYGKDTVATYIVNNRECYFVPCVNPDGYEYNRRNSPNGGGMWRKNRRNNGGGVYGVDLNRNWTTGWTAPNGGNSTNPSSSTYRGTSPLSEPEIAAFEAFITTRKFVIGNSCHTSGELLLYPWGYKNGPPPNHSEYQTINARALAKNPAMVVGPASTTLYIAAGTALDHYHVAHGMYGYTPELGTSSEGGFWPNPTNQVRISNRQQHMFQQFAVLAGANVTVDKSALSEGPGGNNNGKVDPGETGLLRITLANNGAAASLTPVTASLKSLSSGVTITKGTHNFGTIAKFASANNNASPLSLKVDQNYKAAFARVELSIAYETIVDKVTIDLPFAEPVLLVGSDFEKDLGFRRSTADTATTGKFERAVPQRTVYQSRDYQPGADHSPTGTMCWVTEARAGNSVGNYDVDNGKTSLLSPIMDLRHVALPALSIWLYYSESVVGDPFTVELSKDGGSSWTEIYRRGNHTSGWEQIEVNLPGTMTNEMRFRFNAQDTVSASLVEACVDDLEVKGIVTPASLTLLGGAHRGSTARFAYHGAPGAVAVPLLSGGAANVKVPGIGTLLLDPNTLFVLSATAYGTARRLTIDEPIPNDPGLIGLQLHWQQLLVSGATLTLGNSQSFKIQ